MSTLSQRQRFILAALATADGGVFAPVQVQKLFFLLDKKVPKRVGGPYFEFQPYDYGPFDKAIYSELEALQQQGLVKIEFVPSAAGRYYSLTPSGQEKGEVQLDEFEDDIKDYMFKLSGWIRSLSFAELVGSVYKEFPEMRENSVFQD